MMQAETLDHNSVLPLLNGEALPAGLSANVLFGVIQGSQQVKVFHHEDLHSMQKFKVDGYIKDCGLHPVYTKVHVDEFQHLQDDDSETDEEYEATDAEDFFDQLFERAVEQDASDIHIFVYPNDPHILFRINGELERVTFQETIKSTKLMRVCNSIYSSMTGDTGSNLNSYRPELTQKATVKERRAINGHRFRLRYQDCALDGDSNCVHVAMRLLDLDRDFTTSNLVELGYEADQQAMIYDVMLKGPGGLIVIVGATGDGKTTTAATILAQYAQEHQGRKMILTAEDPVEFKIDGVHHVQVSPSSEAETESQAWERHLAAKMRLDPDFIFQGETRTVTTAESACHAALTGHTTMVTLHGNSAFDALGRLEELEVPRTLMGTAGFIKGVVFQRLLPILCPKCSHKYSDYPDEKAYELVEKKIATTALLNRLVTSYEPFTENVRFRNYDGCSECRNGVIKREAVSELVILDEGMRRHILKGNYPAAKSEWKNQGQIPAVPEAGTPYDEQYTQHCVGYEAFDHGIKKMIEGKVSPVDVEDKLGVLSSATVNMDSTIQGEEVNSLTGLAVSHLGDSA